jgi:hypothetical protein
MKILLLLLIVTVSFPICAFDFVLSEKITAAGPGKFEIYDFSGRPAIATLRVPSIEFALKAIKRQSNLMGQKLCILMWDLNGKIFETTTNNFDTDDLWFRKMKANLIGNYSLWRKQQFTVMSSCGKIIGCGFFLGPANLGICDASCQLQSLVGSN